MVTDHPNRWPTGFRVVNMVGTGHQIRLHKRRQVCVVMCRCSDEELAQIHFGEDCWTPFNKHVEEADAAAAADH